MYTQAIGQASLGPGDSRRAFSAAGRALLGLLVAASLGLFANPAAAINVAASVARFNKLPRAPLAWQLSDHFLAEGQLGKAMNWAERALASPGLTNRIQRNVLRRRQALRWDLRDAGFGMFKVTLKPPHAWLSIDGKRMVPRRSQYELWLPEGSHQLDVVAKDYGPESRIISASRGEAREMGVAMQLVRPPELRIEILPLNAEVWSNRQFLGFANRRMFRLTPGPQVVEVRAMGYKQWMQTYHMRAGDRHVLKLKMEKHDVEGLRLRIASDVKRKLTPLELANRGGRNSRLGRVREGAAARSGPTIGMRSGAEDAGFAAPVGAGPGAKAGLSGGGSAGQLDAEDDEDEFSEGGADVTLSGGSGGGSVLKGMLWSGLGLALAGGGVGLSLYSVSGARQLHKRSLGYSGYDEWYDKYKRDAWVGYGISAIGGVSLVVGGMYLFGDKGLSRSGKGWLVTTMGALAGGLGGYLMLDAVAEADAANALPQNDRNYQPNFDGAQQTWWTGLATASAGGALALVGLYVAFSDSSRSADASGVSPSPWRDVAFTPAVSPDALGAVMTMSW